MESDSELVEDGSGVEDEFVEEGLAESSNLEQAWPAGRRCRRLGWAGISSAPW